MKSSPRTSGRRHHVSAGTGGVEIGEDQVTIHLPDPRVLRIVARSVLFAAAIFSLPWFFAMLTTDATEAAGKGAAGSSSSSTPIRWVDDPFFLPMLVRDLRRQGLLAEEGRRVFLGNPSSRLPFLKRNNVDAVSSEEQQKAIRDRSVNFLIAVEGLHDSASLLFAERVLRIGGVAVVSLSSDPSQIFRLPRNYMMVYVRQFGNAIVAIKKTSHAGGGADDEDANATSSTSIRTGRKLLRIPKARAQKEVLRGLEDALLEPPPETTAPGTLRRRIKYLPDVTGATLSDYPRLVFVDVVGRAGRAGSMDWFEKDYPNGAAGFEIVRLVVTDEDKSVAVTGGISDWFRKNVRKEEYVVLKADAEVAEEMAQTGAIDLVDELFMECSNSWWPKSGEGRRGGSNSERAYWECVALHGRLRDEGVAVHQWWG